MASYTTVRIASPPAALLGLENLQAVMVPAGADFLRRQRWFAAKARHLRHVGVRDVIPLATAVQPLALVLVHCDYAEGPPETYQLLLTLLPADESEPPPTVVARLQTPQAPLWLCEATDDPQACLAYVNLLRQGTAPAGMHGGLQADATPDLPPASLPASAVRLVGAEQSNTSVILGPGHILKLYRKLEAGINPDLELGRYLTVLAHSPHVPRFCGSLAYVVDGEPTALAIVQTFVASQGDGWQDALQAIGDYLQTGDPVSLKAYALRVEALGRVTGEIHVALAAARDADLQPETVQPGDVRRWQQAWRAHWGPVAPLLAARGLDVPALASAIARFVARADGVQSGGLKLRVHGDYHLGQVLRVGEGWIVLDFEGEPARPLAERRAKQTPLKDVAGMLRSFSYAADAGLFERAQPGSDAWADLEPRARAWETAARAAFLRGYEGILGDGALLPPVGAERSLLLSLFELDKAVYELDYELNNRPDWVCIPLAGIRRLIDA